MVDDCNLGGSSVCCASNTICHENGACLSASIALSFVSDSSGSFCYPFVTLAGFVPNQTYTFQFAGYRNGQDIGPISRQATTDPLGAFASDFNIGYLKDLDQAYVTVENLTSALVAVTC